MSLVEDHAVTLEEKAQTDLLLCSFSLYERTQISPACAPTVRLRGRAFLQIGRTLLAAQRGDIRCLSIVALLSFARCICPSGLPR